MALPPKGAWKYLVGVGFRSLAEYPAAWPVISVLTLIRIAVILLGGDWLAHIFSPQYGPLGGALLSAPVSFLLGGYCLHGLLFGFTAIKGRHFLLSLWRYLLAALLTMLCLALCMIPAVLVGAAVGFASALLKQMEVSLILIVGIYVLVGLAIFVTILYLTIRLAFMPVVALAEGRVWVSRSWKLSVGWGKTLIACWLVVGVLSALLPLALMMAGSVVGPKLMMAGTSVVSAITAMIYFAILVKAYKKAAQEEPAVSPPSESF